VNGAGGPPFYTLGEVSAAYPNARAVGFGVNIGTYNPSYNVEADKLVFNDTTYDFEVKANAPTDKDQCKDGGWKDFQTSYKNQGDCVSSVASQGKAKGNPSVVESVKNVFAKLF
jgi:hypothetical protein